MMINTLKLATVVLGTIGLLPLPGWAITPLSVDRQAQVAAGAGRAVRAHQLEELAQQMNVAHPAGPDPAAVVKPVLDLKQLPILADILDRDGRLTLPMGLIIYSTMGTTSVGFGSKF
ncbi:MAG: hypothetical protein KGQ93_02550 [Cyanobacteria bacterium REEB459]|nr:hypothetical protein [Cyanobacteria bacterium REEB459]